MGRNRAIILGAFAACSFVAVAQTAPPPKVQPGLAKLGLSGSGANEPYLLEAGDSIEVRFFFNPELNETVQIRPDGRISMQLVGEVEMAGKTVTQAARMLEEVYAKELKTARVSVQVRGFAGLKVFVAGEVNRPGTVSVPGRMTVLGAIVDAGGIKQTGNKNKVMLIRRGPGGTPEMHTLVLMAKNGLAPDSDVMLRPYDVLMVPETKIAKMDRWVDAYIRQLSPANMAVGFNYLWNHTGSTGVLPF